jgi:hypothetical protein
MVFREPYTPEAQLPGIQALGIPLKIELVVVPLEDRRKYGRLLISKD